MEEQTFYSDGGVTVTNARFIVHSQTYAVSGVTSVKSSADEPSRGGPIIFGFIGVMLLLATAFIAAAIFIFIAVAWWLGQKATYHIVLTTASGEAKALSSSDRGFISKVAEALNNAIVSRG